MNYFALGLIFTIWDSLDFSETDLSFTMSFKSVLFYALVLRRSTLRAEATYSRYVLFASQYTSWKSSLFSQSKETSISLSKQEDAWKRLRGMCWRKYELCWMALESSAVYQQQMCLQSQNLLLCWIYQIRHKNRQRFNYKLHSKSHERSATQKDLVISQL